MVNARALKIAAAVAVGAVLLFLASFVLRIVARILTWAVLLLVALAAGYAVYQLATGWRAAGGEADAVGDADAAVDVEDPAADVDEVKDRYAEGELSEAELEAELEAAVEADGDAGSDREPEPER